MGDSWHAFKTGFARTRQKVLAKVGQAEVTKSPEYEAECQKIISLQKSIKRIHENASKYMDVVKAYNAEQEAMAQDILLLAEIGGVGLQVAAAIETERDKMAAEFSQYFDATIVGYMHQFKELKERMDELEIRRVDMDRYFRDYSSITSKSNADAARVSHIETKYNVTKEGYQNLFNELMQDMPLLISDRPRFFDPIIASFALTHGGLYSATAKALDDAMNAVSSINEEDIHRHRAPITPNESSAKNKVYKSIGGAPTAEYTSTPQPVYSPPPSSFASPQPTFSSSSNSSISSVSSSSSSSSSSFSSSSSVVTPSFAPSSSSSSSFSSPSPSPARAPAPSMPAPVPASPTSTRVNMVRASFDFIAQEEGELSFKKGDIIKIIDDDGDWWIGELNGATGTLPSNYVNPV